MLKDEKVLETGKEETPQITEKRDDLGFLISDEIEAIDGYDKALKRADLSEEDRSKLERIRNDEIEHIDILNSIFKTTTTGAIESDNTLAKNNTEDSDVIPANNATVNDPLCSVCDIKENDGILENILNKGLDMLGGVNKMATATTDSKKVEDTIQYPQIKEFIAKAREKGLQYAGQENGKWKFLITPSVTIGSLEELAKEGQKISNTYYQFPHNRYLFIDDCAKKIKDMHFAETDENGDDWCEFDQGDTLNVEGDDLVTRNEEGVIMAPDNIDDGCKVKDNDIQLLREFYNEKQPNKKMEIGNRLKQMGYEEGISGVNTRDIMWVRLNGKRYQVKNLSSVSPLDKASCPSKAKDANYKNYSVGDLVEYAGSYGDIMEGKITKILGQIPGADDGVIEYEVFNPKKSSLYPKGYTTKTNNSRIRNKINSLKDMEVVSNYEIKKTSKTALDYAIRDSFSVYYWVDDPREEIFYKRVKTEDQASRLVEKLEEAYPHAWYVKDSAIKDSDSVNDIGKVVLGSKLRWEEKYGNAQLTVVKIKKGDVTLSLDNGTTNLILPLEKLEKMLSDATITSTSTLNISEYDRVKTVKNYNVKVGDRKFIVKATSKQDAENKVRNIIK